MEKRKSRVQGITMVSLVITIIVLLIIAAIGTYSGISVIKSSKFTKFETGLKIMQAKVNEWYEEEKNGNDKLIDSIRNMGSENEDSIDDNKAEIAFNSANIETEIRSGYILLTEDNLRELEIEQVQGDYLINITKRSVISYEGYEYQGETYYTVEQIPNNLYNVEFSNNEYRIRYFDSDGSKLNTTNPTFYTPETDTFTLENPSKEDNTFLGWTGTGLTEKTENVTIAKGSTGDREYYAIWANDGTRPRIIITTDSGDKTKESTITYTIKFTEPVNGFEENDIVVTNGTIEEFTKVSDTEYKIVIKGGTEGEQTIKIRENAITDLAGNTNEETIKTITIDGSVPTAATITTNVGNITNTNEVTYTITFTEPVNGFAENDIVVTN